MADGRLVAGLLAARGGQGLRAVAAGFGAPARGLRLRRAGRLLLAPPDLRTADPTVAGDVAGGYFAHGGRTLRAVTASPFAATPPSLDWARELAGFGWLRHLRAAGTPRAAADARVLVAEFLRHRPYRPGDPAWATPVTARRLISWMTQSPLILEGADHGAYARFAGAVAFHARLLAARLAAGGEAEARLPAAVALTYAGLSAEGLEGALALGCRLLERELGRTVLPDGGHVTRDAGLLVDLLYDLLPLRRAFSARDVPLPKALLPAIERITPALRLLRHGDGALALFNGTGAVPREALAMLFLYDETRGGVPEALPDSGYARLQAGAAAVIADVGGPPPARYSARAGAGCLAFEFSHGAERLFVNSGAPGSGAGAGARAAARLTPAHSTLTLDGTSSCRFAGPRLTGLLGGAGEGAPVLAGPRGVEAARADEPGAVVLAASHDGYAERFGLIHARRLTLARDGERLAGRDELRPAPGREGVPCRVALQFHLHPDVAVSREDGDGGALLTTRAGEVWRFEAGGRTVGEAPGLFNAAPSGPRPTRRLLVEAEWPEATSLDWSLARVTAREGGGEAVAEGEGPVPPGAARPDRP